MTAINQPSFQDKFYSFLNQAQNTLCFCAESAHEAYVDYMEEEPQDTLRSFVEKLKNGYDDHIRAMPKDTKLVVFKSFLGAFAVGTVFTLSPATGLAFGALSATATLVHAASAPLFQRVLGKTRLAPHEEIVRGCLTCIVTAGLGSAAGIAVTMQGVYLSSLLHFARVSFLDENLERADQAHFVPMFFA